MIVNFFSSAVGPVTSISFADFQRFITDEQSATLYATWASANPGEVTRWSTFRDAIVAGMKPVPPAMLTAHGKALVDVGMVYLDAFPLSAPPPSPVVTSLSGTVGPIKAPRVTTSGVPLLLMINTRQ